MHPLETGGVLLGWRSGVDRIVADLVGPGPRALHGRHRFLPDHAWQVRRIQEAFSSTNGDLDYLGDWHTHPSGRAEMSSEDYATLRALHRHVPGALMVIGAGVEEDWAFGAWSLRPGGLLRRPLVDVRELRSFAAPVGWPDAAH